MMKKTYNTPQVNVIELGAESSILVGADSGKTTNGFGTNDQLNVKKQFNGDIEFDDMKGTDIVRRNPWDSQW